jgi:hypothetical protein
MCFLVPSTVRPRPHPALPQDDGNQRPPDKHGHQHGFGNPVLNPLLHVQQAADERQGVLLAAVHQEQRLWEDGEWTPGDKSTGVSYYGCLAQESNRDAGGRPAGDCGPGCSGPDEALYIEVSFSINSSL